jgi:hypothetical protein
MISRFLEVCEGRMSRGQRCSGELLLKGLLEVADGVYHKYVELGDLFDSPFVKGLVENDAKLGEDRLIGVHNYLELFGKIEAYYAIFQYYRGGTFFVEDLN